MNDFHMINLANTTISERRAEADRHRLARAASTAQGTAGNASDSDQQPLSRPRLGLGSFFGRPVLR